MRTRMRMRMRTRMRTRTRVRYEPLQAVSWSWRPYSCALAPVRGEAFDRWLGARHLLLLGDSLMAQLYYSLVWLLGDVLVLSAGGRSGRGPSGCLPTPPRGLG